MPWGIVVTMLYSTSVYSRKKRQTNEAGDSKGGTEGEMPPAACCHLSNVVTVPHYVLFQSSSSIHASTHTDSSSYCCFHVL